MPHITHNKNISKPIIYLSIKQNTIRKYFRKKWEGTGATGTLIHCYVKAKWLSHSGCLQFPIKLKIH